MRIIRLFLLGLLILLFSQEIFAMPAQVFLIRHGEKPLIGNDLNAQGRERAEALVGYFMHAKALTQFGTPVAIYAEGSPDHLTRSVETCAPLAKVLHLPVFSQFTVDDYTPMVKEILQNSNYNGKAVLICWEHKRIPAIATALGATPIPLDWPDTVFDRTWVITYHPNGTVASFQNLPQKLLPGDETQ